MSFGPFSPFAVTMASAGTLTSQIDLGAGWSQAYLEIPSMTSNTQIYIRGASTDGGTFRRVKHPSINSSTVTTNDFVIQSTATNCFVPMPAGVRFVKIETEVTVNDGCVFKIVCT